MNLSSFQLLVFHILLPTLSLACSSGRCSQFYKKHLDSVLDSQLAIDLELLEPMTDNENQTILAPTVKFTLSGRHLSGVEDLVTPSAWPIIWINNNLYRDGVCLVHDNQNPNWRDNFEVAYDEGANTFLKIEVRSQSSGFWGYDDFWIGSTLVYVKDMLCKGRVIESPLWRGDGGFLTGYIAVTTTDVLNGGGKCD